METENTQSRSTGSKSVTRGSRSHGDPASEITEAWNEASSAVQNLYSRASEVLQTQVEERPYAALAAAAGIGFVLGGGLSSPTGRYLLRSAAQLLVPVALASLQGDEE